MADYNGVTLPDIPAEALVEYPYAIIVSMTQEGTTQYALLALPSEVIYLPADKNSEGVDLMLCLGYNGLVYGYADGEWVLEGEYGENFAFPSGTLGTTTYTLAWANHNVMYGEEDSEGNVTVGEEVYLAGTGVVLPPDEYSITREDVVFLADQTRRLTGGTGKLGFAEIKSGLESVSGEPTLQDKTITENGTYTADEGYDGLGTVTVELNAVVLADNERIYQVGTAASTLDMSGLSFASSAVGTLSG